jgi:N utilization substance protein B
MAREMALQTLFQLDYNVIATNEALDSIFAEHQRASNSAKEYAKTLVEGTLLYISEVDKIITATAREWKIERMSAVDRNILRLAIYELSFGEEQLTPGVVINEAVELAKTYASEESGKFVNGIVGSIVKGRMD